MNLFHIIDDGAVIVRNKPGVYRQVKLYERDGKLYAGHGAGFVKLIAKGRTSHPNISWLEADAGGVGEIVEERKTMDVTLFRFGEAQEAAE